MALWKTISETIKSIKGFIKAMKKAGNPLSMIKRNANRFLKNKNQWI